MGGVYSDVRVTMVPAYNAGQYAALLGEELRLSRTAGHLLWTGLDSVLVSPNFVE